MKHIPILFLIAVLLLSCAHAQTPSGNYSDEMKIPRAEDLCAADGADHGERSGDHEDSPYFSRLDFYHNEFRRYPDRPVRLQDPSAKQ